MADKYYIKENITKSAPHHESIKALWETKWKKPVCRRPHTQVDFTDPQQCEMGVYPFMFGSIKDFEPVFESLIQVGNFL